MSVKNNLLLIFKRFAQTTRLRSNCRLVTDRQKRHLSSSSFGTLIVPCLFLTVDCDCVRARGKADVLYVADAFAVMAKINDLLKKPQA
jgi:hypothetical protein